MDGCTAQAKGLVGKLKIEETALARTIPVTRNQAQELPNPLLSSKRPGRG